MANKTTNANQVTNHIVAGTGKTTEEIWAQQIAGTSILALVADGTAEYAGVELATTGDIADMVESTNVSDIVLLADQQAYDDLDPPVSTTLYLVPAV